MKVLYAATVLCTYLLLSGINYPSMANDSLVKVVVIDAGHGGHDPGAIGITGVKEKDVVLSIALKVGNMIEKNTDVKVIYTRKTDVFVELYKRAQMANNNHADMFISIHCNSVENNSVATGAETFVMGLDKSQANLAIAQKENSAILSEKNHESNYGGFDPTSPEAYIIFSLYQNVYLNQSINLAAAIQSEFKTICKLQDRGVKQGALLVLWRSAMPSVLIETGFLSNKQEEAYLASEKGQTELSLAIYNGFAKVAQLPAMDMQDVENLANKKPTKSTTSTTPNSNASEVIYKVQFLTSSKKLAKTDPELKNLSDVDMEKTGSVFKYLTGYCVTYTDAQDVLTKVKKAGFPDAFIVAYKKDGTRITLQQAKELENKK
ncbi:MAG: N-acetylmuramoyl-L-alanine amidase [Bacteroidales bacterium]|jgi:N-acetylmuramoyl-L-alanine amidase|nr:N-acetylmuramoyl-L-alanine amidase [Bacteroidales bacterium]